MLTVPITCLIYDGPGTLQTRTASETDSGAEKIRTAAFRIYYFTPGAVIVVASLPCHLHTLQALGTAALHAVGVFPIPDFPHPVALTSNS